MMLIEVKRKWFSEKSTIGEMFVNGAFECYTLEDKMREVAGRPVAEWKVDGQTAIPAGGYDVIVNMSNRFKRLMPLLVNVPGFDGVRIHSGNVAENTEGCILVGNQHGQDFIGESRIAFDFLFPKIQGSTEPVRIVITNEAE